MISEKALKSIEFDKIMNSVAEFAVINKTKEILSSFSPLCDIKQANALLEKTQEAYKLLYDYSVGSIYYFDDITEELDRVDMGGSLINGELLKVVSNLKSARLLKNSINSVKDDNITEIPLIVNRLYTNLQFEEEITSKIISEDEIADNASPKLASIRRNIRNINVKIRERLNSYMRSSCNRYLQENVVTRRQDRYVIPVKSEYKSFIKGFIHDQSSSGATVFIEPEQVMDLNNELKSAMIEESDEIRRILAELSAKVASMSDLIRFNKENIVDVDCCFARAGYSFANKCTFPELNEKGIIDIRKGRHPLIDKSKVVPVTVSFGENYNLLLISGPNTGGKTVTLKLSGLFSLMAMSGIYLPAEEGSRVSVFLNLFTDIGDEQSIEQSLSTFSSHMKNIIDIVDNADSKSLVLIDELGAGTDPEEGSALALAVIENLLDKKCMGIITTHYSKLKEFAVENPKIENASMEFDSVTLKPLYKLNIGIPGSSNAIEIAKTLGLKKEIIYRSLSFLSDSKISFENILKKAEESRRKADELANELEQIKRQKDIELKLIEEEKEKIIKEKEKISTSAKQEVKHIVSERLEEAEEIISELKSILKTVGLESKEVFRASELKNRLLNSRYLDIDINDAPIELKSIDINKLSEGERVYIKSMNVYGVIVGIKKDKKEAEVLIGDVRTKVKTNDIFNAEKIKQTQNKVKVFKKAVGGRPVMEVNVIGKDSIEAITEVDLLIDNAVINGIEEVKIIHGIGEGILLKAIREHLKKDKNVLEFRKGKYGEGENGVTIVKLK